MAFKLGQVEFNTIYDL